MTNHQASLLRPGMTIRRKEPFESRSSTTRREILIVEWVEPKATLREEVTVHTGGQALKGWEIERVWYLDNQETP